MTSLDDVVRSTEHRLLRLALMLSGSRHNAEDLVQSVLARAHRQWERIGGLEHPEAYLRTMVVNEYLGWRRLLKNREVPLAEPIERPADFDLGARQAQRDATWRLLTRLPRKQRAVLVLRYYEDLSYADIAAVLGCSMGTVASQVSEALNTLRQRVGPESAALLPDDEAVTR